MAESSPIAVQKNEEYDAFIAHSHMQEEFIKTMVGDIESYGFRCYHYERDATAGQTIIGNISENIDKSKKVILVISKDFLKSRWCEFEGVEAMTKAVTGGKGIIPILYEGVKPGNLPTYLKDSAVYLEYPSDNRFYQRLVKALKAEVTLTASVPAGNVANGLAWSYYFGYLKLVLPGLKERVMKSKFWKKEKSEILWKMTIICPEDCYCPGVLTDTDPEIHFDKDSYDYIDYKTTRAGNINRDYKSSVYSIKEDGKTYYFLAELATPLRSIYEMEQEELAGLSKEQKFHQMKLFYEKLQEILEKSPKCKDAFVLIKYEWSLHEDDRDKQPEGFVPLSQVILARIKQELADW